MNLYITNPPWRFSKSDRAIIFFTFMVCLFYLINILNFNPHSSIQISQECFAQPEGKGFCNVTCNYNVSRDSYGRVLVTHTIWASIFEERFNISKGKVKSIQIQIPSRNYTYNIRSIFWIDSDNYGASGVNLIC